MQAYEFKIWKKGNLTRWEDLPAITITTEDLDKTLAVLRITIADIVEIRWNYPGSPQGHYENGNCKISRSCAVKNTKIETRR